MTPGIGLVVRCGRLAHRLFDTIRSIERQDAGAAGVVLVSDRTTPSAVRPWLDAFARHRELPLVESFSDTPGAAWNAGVRGTSAPLLSCLEAGDQLDRRFTRLSTDLMLADPAPSLVSTGWVVCGVAGESRRTSPACLDAGGLIADFDAAHRSSVFRRTSFDAVGGFDETLPLLASFEFFLRLVLASGAGVAHRLTLVEQEDEAASHDPRARARAVAAIIARHRGTFSTFWLDALSGQHTRAHDVSLRRRALCHQRRATTASMDATRRRIETARATLADDGRADIPWGGHRRLAPLSNQWGFDRGLPVDRSYIVDFLRRHADDIHGTVLEVQEPVYSRQFGGSRVTLSDVLDISPENQAATIVADLRAAPNIPDDAYDCLILTQTLHAIDDMTAAIRECARVLRPGGVLLATFPAASLTSVEYGRGRDFWRLTEDGVRQLGAAAFPSGEIHVTSYGNVLTTSASLYGVASHELTEAELWTHDRLAATVLAMRAVKPDEASGLPPRVVPRS